MAGLVVLCILLLVASVALVRGHRDSGITPAADGGESEGDAVADLGVFATVLLNDLRRRSPAAGRAVDSCSGAAARVWATLAGRLPRVAPWFDPRGHWWRFCTLAAVALGVLAAAVHAVFDGGPSSWSVHDLVMSVYAGAIFVVLEGGAVIASAALLGRFLGLASDRPSDNRRMST
jgi:hypothetical protein